MEYNLSVIYQIQSYLKNLAPCHLQGPSLDFIRLYYKIAPKEGIMFIL